MNNYSVRFAYIIMIALVVARGTSFMFSKTLLTDLGPFTLLGIRFLIAFLLLFAFFARRIFVQIKKDPGLLPASLALGGIYFVCMATELIGLQYTGSSTCAFLENAAIVIVPIFEAILIRKLPSLKVILCCLVTTAGIGLITLNNGLQNFGFGEIMCCLAALTFAIALIINDRTTKNMIPFLLESSMSA